MQDQHPRRFISLVLLASCSLLVVGSGAVIAWWTWNTPSQRTNLAATVQKSQDGHISRGDPSLSLDSTATSGQQSPSPNTATTEISLQVYWLQPVGDRIKLVAEPVKVAARHTSEPPEPLLQAAVNKLLAGPDSSSSSTTIPAVTKLRSLSVKENGIYLDLSREFTIGGGSVSMVGRVAQVLYTVTSLSPNAKVWLLVEGKPLETLGGEGVLLDQPMTRDRFQQLFPDALVK